jgi:hypothetical protein
VHLIHPAGEEFSLSYDGSHACPDEASKCPTLFPVLQTLMKGFVRESYIAQSLLSADLVACVSVSGSIGHS